MTDSPARIVIVDDDQEQLFALESLLSAHGYQVSPAGNGREALQRIEAELPDLVLLDVVMPEMDGLELTKALKADPTLRYIPVALVSSKDDLADVKRGLDLGADDYIKKPFRKEELLARVNAMLRTRALYRQLQQSQQENVKLQRQLSERFHFSKIIGRSSAMQQVYDLIEKVSAADVPVLITGESGTGKELVARAIHYTSERRHKAWVVQNCSAFHENLLESELFGHVRGAFTGATRDKAGLFEAADGGTFFLDELGELNPATQAKLLRVLQDGTFLPVGSTRGKQVNVRVLAATNADIKALTAQGRFRQDLYYRVSVITITLPPLRERRIDIPLLVDSFLDAIAQRSGKERKEISPEVLQVLVAYDWPGNVRELHNEIERLVIMSGNDGWIDPPLLSPHLKGGAASTAIVSGPTGSLKEAVEDLEGRMIGAVLQRLQGNKSEAARELGISRSSLIKKAKLLGLE